MKIITAWVDDPTLDGELDPPLLCVETDEYPDRTSDPIETTDGWSQAKFGPFVLFDFEPKTDISAGDYNVRFAGTMPPIVDVALVVQGRNYSGMFGLPLTRARQLVRKHCEGWRLYISDKEAQHGTMLWLPQMVEPSCRFWMPGHVCGRTDRVVYVRKEGVDFPLCTSHLQDHNKAMANRRRYAS
jgi:hypothetical protein